MDIDQLEFAAHNKSDVDEVCSFETTLHIMLKVILLYFQTKANGCVIYIKFDYIFLVSNLPNQ